MANYREHTFLSGSERAPLAGARAIGATNAEETLNVTLLLRSRNETESRMRNRGTFAAANTKIGELLRQHPRERKHLTREDFLTTRGALQEDVAKVEQFAHAYGLTIVRTSLLKRSVELTGSVANFNKAFHVELLQYVHANRSYRGRTGPVYIPNELAGIVKAVLGLDNRPQAHPHFRTQQAPNKLHTRTQLPDGTFTPVQLGQLYDFPQNADGTGQCIAIIELGGGYKPLDLDFYFKNILNIATPKIVAVSVDGGQNSPAGDANSPDGEVMLDIEVAGAIAPKSTIVVYFASNSDKGFYDAIATAIHDPQYKPSVVSISWGGSESLWSQQSLTQYNSLFEDAALLGITVCAASGDNGSTDGITDGLQHVDFPASSPYVLACGGTKLTAANNKIADEVVWNEAPNGGATGGGVSDFFAKPDYQSNSNVPASKNTGNLIGRGVPDVAGDADPSTGYNVYVDGQGWVMGGTSAVAPLWGGFVLLINQLLGKPVGNLTWLLYANPATLHNITSGDNGAFSAAAGWSACTGLGSPNAASILSLIQSQGAK